MITADRATEDSEVEGLEPDQPRLLIVDDQPLNRSVLRIMAEGAGYRVEEAKDGPSALSWVQGDRFDAVLLDLRMPGMDGYEVCRRIRAAEQEREHLPFIAVTVDDLNGTVVAMRQAGMDGHLAKPFSRDELLSIVKFH